MFGWLKRGRPRHSKAARAAVHDDVLGTIAWDAEEEAWVALVSHSAAPFRILIAGEGRPSPVLVSHARDIFVSPEKLLAEVAPVLKRAADEIPVAAREILGLHVESVALMWPDRPDDGMIYFDGPGTEERIWRCDYVERRPRDLAFDD
jgi:hypothetical protein